MFYIFICVYFVTGNSDHSVYTRMYRIFGCLRGGDWFDSAGRGIRVWGGVYIGDLAKTKKIKVYARGLPLCITTEGLMIGWWCVYIYIYICDWDSIGEGEEWSSRGDRSVGVGYDKKLKWFVRRAFIGIFPLSSYHSHLYSRITRYIVAAYIRKKKKYKNKFHYYLLYIFYIIRLYIYSTGATKYIWRLSEIRCWMIGPHQQHYTLYAL